MKHSDIFLPIRKKAHNDSGLYPHTLELIQHYSDKYKDYPKNAAGTKRLIKKMKTNNFNKLYNKRKEWDNLDDRVSKEYLEALGITCEMLETTVEMDKELFWEKANEPATYRHATLYRKWLSKVVDFEEELSEYEAIELCKELWKDEELSQGFWHLSLANVPYYSISISDHKNSPCYNYYSPKYTESQYYIEFYFPLAIGLYLK